MTPYENYAVLVLCANDVDVIWHNLAALQGNPVLPAAAAPGAGGIAYINAGNFAALAQLRCDDQIISKSDNVYYGLVLRATPACPPPFKPGDFLVAVRGTMNQQEWENDALALLPRPAPNGWAGSVGTGFWDIYDSMTMCDLAGVPGAASAPDAIAALVKAEATPGNTVFVCGHSLGAALATYLAADLQVAMAAAGVAAPVDPYFFASPKPGTTDYVNAYQRNVTAYSLVNYAIDLVPMVPPELLGYAALNAGGPTHDVHTIAYPTAGGLQPPLPAQNHSPVGYARMLDPNNAVARLLPAP
jgi:hypothetical protein